MKFNWNYNTAIVLQKTDETIGEWGTYEELTEVRWLVDDDGSCIRMQINDDHTIEAEQFPDFDESSAYDGIIADMKSFDTLMHIEDGIVESLYRWMKDEEDDLAAFYEIAQKHDLFAEVLV